MDHETCIPLAEREEATLQCRIASLAARQHNVVAARQLIELGLSEKAIGRWAAGCRLHRVRRGVYAVGSPRVTDHGRVMAAVLACGDHSFASHRTAAWIWALGIDRRGFEVTVARDNASDAKGITVRTSTFAGGETRTRSGIPVTSLERTLIDLAAVLDENALGYALDQAGKHNLNLTLLRRLVEQHARRRGIAKLRRVLEEHYPTNPVKSPLEWLAKNFCRREGLPRPQVNVLVGTGKGTREGDLVFRDARFILEIASKEHHSSWAARMRDHDRDIELALAGWLVLHATKPQLVSGPRSRALGAQLRELIAARSAPRA